MRRRTRGECPLLPLRARVSRRSDGAASAAYRLPTATLITLIAGTAAATFGGVIALAGMAASLFFNPGSTSPPQKNSRRPTSRSRATTLEEQRNGYQR
jgi:hypothetical protein